MFATPEQAQNFNYVDIIDEHLAFWQDLYDNRSDYGVPPKDVIAELRSHIVDGVKPKKFENIIFIHEVDEVILKTVTEEEEDD